MPKVPRQLGLTNREETRVVRLLSALPRVSPEISITMVGGSAPEIVFTPDDEVSLPPVVGAQGVYADYEALDGEFTEATLVWNRRRIGVRHMLFLDNYGTGGAWDDGTFNICWHSRSITRTTSTTQWRLNEFSGLLKKVGDRRLTSAGRIEWIDSENCAGPEDGGALFAGRAVVEVGERSFDCVRAIQVWPEEPSDYSTEPGEPLVKWVFLDDTYLAGDGRIVLTRRFASQEYYDWNEWRASAPVPWTDWSEGRQGIVYNGVAFRHSFDILTDVLLGWPAKPPFRQNKRNR